MARPLLRLVTRASCQQAAADDAMVLVRATVAESEGEEPGMVDRLQRCEQRSATPLVVLAIAFIVVYAPVILVVGDGLRRCTVVCAGRGTST